MLLDSKKGGITAGNAARTCKKLPVASFCASETAETGRIANGREQGDHVGGDKGGEKARGACCPEWGKSFFVILFVLYKKYGKAARRKKDSILFVRSRCCSWLIRGLENLEAPCKGTFFGTFCGVQKVPQKHAEGCGPLDSRGRFKALPEIILKILSTARAEIGFSHKTAAKRL